MLCSGDFYGCACFQLLACGYTPKKLRTLWDQQAYLDKASSPLYTHKLLMPRSSAAW